MSLPLAYGLVAQALITAAAVRVLLDRCLPQAAAKPAPHDAAARTTSVPSGSEQRGGDLPRGAALGIMAGSLALLVPIGGPTLAEHMRGVWGDPSVVTCAILAMFIARPGRLPGRPSRMMCIGTTLLVAVPLYGPMFGLKLPLQDLYSMGWTPYALLVAIALCALLMRVMGRWCNTWAMLLAVALLAYAARAMESSNLLDYMADPGLMLTLAAMAALPRSAGRPQR